MKQKLSIIGKLRLLFQLSRINLKMAFLTSIGLTIALSMISAELIYLDSNKAHFYLAMYEDTNQDWEYYTHTDDFESLTRSNFVEIHESFHSKIKDNNLETVVTPENIETYLQLSDGDLSFLNQSGRKHILGLDLDDSFLLDCINGSRLPNAKNEVLFFNPGTVPFIIGDNINTSVFYREDSGLEQSYNQNEFEITGILTPSSLRNNSLLQKIIELNRYVLIANITSYIDFFQVLTTDISSLANRSVHLSTKIIISVNLNTSVIMSTNVVDVTQNLFEFYEEIAYSPRFGNFEFYFSERSLKRTIEAGIKEFNTFYTAFLLFSIPSLVLTMLLVNFSLGILNQKRKKSLVLLKMRGLSQNYNLTILIIETIIIALLSSLVAILLGIPFSLIIGTSRGYLNFKFDLIPAPPIITQGTIQTVIIIGLVFSFFANYRSIVRLTRSSIVTIDQEANRNRKRNVGLLRGNVDLFLIGQGIIGILILNTFMEIINNSGGSVYEGVFIIFLPIIAVLLFLSPITFLVGFIFAFNRFIPLIIQKMGKFFWTRDRGLLATATRNLSVNMWVTSRATLVIACSISFLMILSVLPTSIYQNTMDSLYYQQGSDLQIRMTLIDNSSQQELFSQLSTLPGLKVTRVHIFHFEITTGVSTRYEASMLGIEQNFHQVAHWRNTYDDDSLEKLISSIYNSTMAFPLIIDSVSAETENLTSYNTYNMPIDDSQTIEFTITDVSNYWPGLVTRRYDFERFFVTSRAALMNFTESRLGYDYSDKYLWCKIEKGFDQRNVINQAWEISNLLGIDEDEFHSVKDAFGIDSERLSSNFLWVITNFNFFVSLLIISILIILFTLTRITSHTSEIGLSRALGMKYRQVFILMFIEPFLLFLISGIPGGIVGIMLLSGIITIFGQAFLSGPPFILDFNLPAIALIYGSILLVTVLTGVLTSYKATQTNISKILRVE